MSKIKVLFNNDVWKYNKLFLIVYIKFTPIYDYEKSKKATTTKS